MSILVTIEVMIPMLIEGRFILVTSDHDHCFLKYLID